MTIWNRVLKKYSNQIILSILLVSGAGLIGCQSSVTRPDTSQAYYGESNAVSSLTANKIYKVSLYSEQFPLVTGKIFTFKLRLTTPDGTPLENKKIRVHGGMPQHQHGFPTAPRVSRYLGDGYYLVEGIKFSMPGEWEIRFNIKEETQRDRIIFKVTI